MQILDYGLADYVTKFEAISEAATKEGNLERALVRMHLDWTEIAFVVNPYRDTGTYVIASIDDIQLLLDDHLIKAQTMKNSLYIKPFEKETLLVTFNCVYFADSTSHRRVASRFGNHIGITNRRITIIFHYIIYIYIYTQRLGIEATLVTKYHRLLVASSSSMDVP